MLILASIFLLLFIAGIAYFGIGVMHRKWEESQKSKADKTASQLEEMFVFVKKNVLITLYIAIPLVVIFASYLATGKWWLALIFGVIGVIFPVWLVNFIDKRRRYKFIVQLVDGLMILNSCLKGGLTLVQAFEILAEETGPPMSQEIALLNREIKVGVTLEEALMRLNKRMPSEEMTLVSSAILVARETGGDLTKVFIRLIDTIRDRLKLREMISTLTLQARLQAIIISMLGPIFVFIVWKIQPTHFDIMWQDELGRWLILIAVVLQIMGFVLIGVFGKIEI